MKPLPPIMEEMRDLIHDMESLMTGFSVGEYTILPPPRVVGSALASTRAALDHIELVRSRLNKARTTWISEMRKLDGLDA